MRLRISRLVLAILLFAAPLAHAGRDEPERDLIDARFEGYPQVTALESNSDGMTWALFVFLGVLCLAGMFKNARRTHLD